MRLDEWTAVRLMRALVNHCFQVWLFELLDLSGTGGACSNRFVPYTIRTMAQNHILAATE